MWDIGSTLRRRWVEVAWGLFAAANVAVIVLLSRWETIPFHFVWVSLTLVYGFRLWRLRTTMILLVVVIAVTGAALAWSITRGHEGPDELAEVPLMAAMFLAMVWHAERRQAAVEEAGRLAESEHRLLMGQREFVRDASHELRTPITVARGHAELIRDAGTNGQVSEDAEVILDELGHLSRLSERLLILTTAGHPGFLSTSSVPIEPFLRGLLRRWSPTAEREWQVRITARGTIRADRERLETALDGLLENAVEATVAGDAIHIGCFEEGQDLVIEVADRGRGIRATDLPKIFDRFSRVEADRARSNGGTGLGLSITKAIVEAHGGSIAVESELGAGATFRITLGGFRRAVSFDAHEGVPAARPSAELAGNESTAQSIRTSGTSP
jgi:signal transduction histidine kinase